MERPRTPSPNKGKQLEKGAFSSLSTLNYYKPPIEDRRKQTSQTSRDLSRPRLPFNGQLLQTSSQQQKRPVSARNERSIYKSKGETENQQLEVNQMQDSIKNLQIQLNREKRNSKKLQAEIADIQRKHKIDKQQLTQDLEQATLLLQKTRGSQKALALERERLNNELIEQKDQMQMMKSQITNLGETLLDIIFQITTLQSNTELEIEYQTQIRNLACQKLQKLGKESHIDFNEIITNKQYQYQEKQTNLPLQMGQKHKHINPSLTRMHQKDSIHSIEYSNQSKCLIEQENNTQTSDLRFSYDVEYFSDDSAISSNNSTLRDFQNPLKQKNASNSNINDKKVTNQSHFESFAELLVSSEHDEAQYQPEKQFAIALFDFHGEQTDDLVFNRGDVIEILQKHDSGWWVGRLGSYVGSFPYNFIQLL